jgi:hypothetical protein
MSTHAFTRSRRGLTAVIAIAALTAAAGAAAEAQPRGPDAATIRDEAQLATATQSIVSPRAATPAAGRALGGFNVQGWPIVLEVSGNAKRIQLTVTGLNMTCTSGARFPVQAFWQRLTVARNGRVRAARPMLPVPGSPVSITGGSDSFAGLLNRRQATIFGAWRLHVDYGLPHGQSDHCDSGLVGFAARL